MKSKWNIGAAAAFVAVLAALVAVPLASANTPTLTANLDCNGTVTWMLSSNGFGGTFTITDATLGLEGSGTLSAGNSYSTSGSYSIPTSVTADTVTAHIIWDSGDTDNTTPSVQITRPDNCTPPPPPPPPVCTYTKGFYRNHASATAGVIAGMGGTIPLGNAVLSAAQAQAILKATPGQPGNVTFTSNFLLNFAQQVITAELNVQRGSPAGPDVQAAIAAANSGINVSLVGGTIGLSSSLPDGSSLESTLDTFNSSNDCP